MIHQQKRLEVSLFIIRITAAIFLGLWATLKFHRPSWTQNIFKGSYGLESLGLETLPPEASYLLGGIQILIVLAFALGLWKTWTYGLMMLMSAAGVLGSLGSYVGINEAGEIIANYTKYPRNLMLTAIPTLGALTALFIMRHSDNFLSLSKNDSPK